MISWRKERSRYHNQELIIERQDMMISRLLITLICLCCQLALAEQTTDRLKLRLMDQLRSSQEISAEMEKRNQKRCLIPARKWYPPLQRIEPVLIVDLETCVPGTLGERISHPYGETKCPKTEGPQFVLCWTVRFSRGSHFYWRLDLYSDSKNFTDEDLTLQVFNCKHEDVTSYCNPGVTETKLNTIFKDRSYILIVSSNLPNQTGDFRICFNSVYPIIRDNKHNRDKFFHFLPE